MDHKSQLSVLILFGIIVVAFLLLLGRGDVAEDSIFGKIKKALKHFFGRFGGGKNIDHSGRRDHRNNGETPTTTIAFDDVPKLVVEQLIKGPVSEHTYPCIPPETKVLNITTKDGTCYVNLDGGFLAQVYDVAEAIQIYAIVNSLAELQCVNNVQILINGETPKVYKEKISFETIFQRDMDLVEVTKEMTE